MNRRQLTGTPADYEVLKRFLSRAGSSLLTFRYFASRPHDVITSHLYTVLILDAAGEPVAYGHLDPEGAVVWLGICVTEDAQGQGCGTLVMADLLAAAVERGLPALRLKVDAANQPAIGLYRKFGFVSVHEVAGSHLIMERHW